MAILLLECCLRMWSLENVWIAIFDFVILRVYFNVLMILSHLLEIIGYRTGCQFRSRDIQSNLPKINLNVPLAYLLFFLFSQKSLVSEVIENIDYIVLIFEVFSSFFVFWRGRAPQLILKCESARDEARHARRQPKKHPAPKIYRPATDMFKINPLSLTMDPYNPLRLIRTYSRL